MSDDAVENHLRDLAQQVHRELLEERGELDDRLIRARVRAAAPMCTPSELERLHTFVREQLDGFGPLETLLGDPEVTEVMVNGPGPVWVERRGRLELSRIVVDDATLRMVIDRAVGRRDVRLDRLMPFADTRLPDGSRVHVAIAPMALDGPCVTIRRFGPEVHPLSAFASGVTRKFVEQAVADRANILVCGPTGSGKTSLLNAIGGLLPAEERVITIEDSAELRFPGNHVVRLEARPPNAEGAGEITMRTLVRNALRMRPDRIIVGEVRGAEAFDMVQALNTGHRGSFATCHANSPTDAIDRVASMTMMADLGLPSDLVRAQVASAFDLVIAVERAPGGGRRIDRILEPRRGAQIGSPEAAR